MNIFSGFIKIENNCIYYDYEGVLLLEENVTDKKFKMKDSDSDFSGGNCRVIKNRLVFNIYRVCAPEEAFTNEKREKDYVDNNIFLKNILGKESEVMRWGNVYNFDNGNISSVNDVKQGFAYLSIAVDYRV